MQFNSYLIEVYGSTEDPEKKRKCILIAEKNLEVAKKYYGEERIYTLKHELSLSTNCITQLKIAEAQEHIAKMRYIVQKFHDDDPKQLMNQFLFLGQILIAMTLMNT